MRKVLGDLEAGRAQYQRLMDEKHALVQSIEALRGDYARAVAEKKAALTGLYEKLEDAQQNLLKFRRDYEERADAVENTLNSKYAEIAKAEKTLAALRADIQDVRTRAAKEVAGLL
ncbi:MAG: hypothetical protein L0177_15340 [Chloroflexi bacterium]|nr:hypothetical protein [Chloroflexota bacterium]